MSDVELLTQHHEISAESKIITAIEATKHQLVMRMLYPGRKGMPISPDLSESILITGDRDQEFISLFVDGGWGTKSGRMPTNNRQIVPIDIIEIWASMKDTQFDKLRFDLWQDADQIRRNFYRQNISFQDLQEFTAECETKEAEITGKYLFENRVALMSGLHEDLVFTLDIMSAVTSY